MLGRQDRASWRQRRTLYCNWGDILEILHRGNSRGDSERSNDVPGMPRETK